MNVLPFMPEPQVKEVHSLLIDFLWQGKPSPIAHNTMISEYSKGGANMIDISCKERAIKATWAVRLNNSNASWASLAYEHLNPDLGSLLLKCNISEKDAKSMPIINSFWKDVLISWCTYNFKEPSTKADVRSQVLWFNSCLKIGGQLYLINKAKNAGIIYVRDIVHDNGDFFTLDEIYHRYGHCITLMQYNSLKSCIPKEWKECLREDGNGTKKSKIESISKMPHVCKHIYSYLINIKSKEPVKAQDKWNAVLGTNITNWENIYSNVFIATICTKFRDFQFRLLHRSLVTNKKLVTMKKSTNNKCTFCNIELETIEHLLFECQSCQVIWLRLFNLISQQTGLPIDPTKTNIILGIPLQDKSPIKQAINTCIVIGKQYIYACRCLNKIPNFQELLERIRFYKLIEYKIALKNNKAEKHERKWNSLKL